MRSGERCVLVVEDDPLVAEVVEALVTSLKLRAVLAVDGESAIELFERLQDSICCVILDYELPGMHSSVALARFRELRPEIKVILSTGYSSAEVAGYLGSVDAYIPKPYGPGDLIGHLRQFTETPISGEARK